MDTSKKWSKGNKRISPVFLRWRPAEAWHIVRAHPWLMFLFINFALVIPLEYNISMIEPRGEPYDAGFVITKRIHNILELRPTLNHVLAAANTTNQFGQILLAKSISLSWYNASGVCQALVVFQIVYIAWAWVVEGRFRPVLASAFMFSSRGILGYSTQLPVPQEFLGSGVDFPVGHVSFFLFFSGHVGASIIATLDLRCVNRVRGALVMDMLNVLQTMRLLATRGHYTIDLVSGAFAGWACYHLAGLCEERIKTQSSSVAGVSDYIDLNL